MKSLFTADPSPTRRNEQRPWLSVYYVIIHPRGFPAHDKYYCAICTSTPSAAYPVDFAESRALLPHQDVDGLVLDQAHDGADLVALALQLVSAPHRPGRSGDDEPVTDAAITI